jgi:filamentous hemagglutinin family protein
MEDPLMRRRDRFQFAAAPAVIAAALLFTRKPVAAQAFLGTPTVVLGTVGRTTGPGTETITVDSAQATINWLPTDTGSGGPPINFLPGGNSVTFESGVGVPYTVLNRIIAADPTRAIALNGLVSSDPIGNVWFYAPGGLLIGGTAQFDVGGLLLTANDPVGAAAGQPFITGSSFQLAAAAGSTASVTINAGAGIQADNYVIAVAPRIDMNGAINLASLGASAALVMAEDVSFTLNGGLFDITANIGSAAGGTSTVGGSITGTGGIGGQGVYGRIYMMAVPRNVGMTMLISGGAQLGFDIANAADVDGNAIVLSGGYDIVGTPTGVGTTQFSPGPANGAAAANVVVDNSQITSHLALRSNDFGRVEAVAGNTSAAGGVEIYADSEAVARASGGRVLAVTGDLRVDASALPVLANGQNRAGGIATVRAETGGRMSASGDILALALGVGEAAFSPVLAGGSGLGGTARVTSDGAGSLISAPALVLDASGIGGVAADGPGGGAQGGLAELGIAAGGALAIGGSIDIRADAQAELGAAGYASGSAQGGGAILNLDPGTSLTLAGGGLTLSANGLFAESLPVAHTAGGTARGGLAEVRVENGSTLETQGLLITADATGSPGGGGNSFVGGEANLAINDGAGVTQVIVADDLLISASALATAGDVAGNAAGGSATGGTARINSNGNPVLNLGGVVDVRAEAIGGNGAGGVGGSATGGVADIALNDGGSFLAAANVLISGRALGGNGTAGGAATATDNGINQPAAARLRLGPGTLAGDQGFVIGGDLILDASASAGSSTAAAGAAARGGFGVVVLDSGQLTAANLSITTEALGGAGTSGGIAQAGPPQLVAREALVDIAGVINMRFGATGGTALDGFGGAGGDARSGRLDIFTQSAEGGGVARITSLAMTLEAAAIGGAGGSGLPTGGIGGVGGNAFAAGAGVFALGGDGFITTGSVSIDASGTGGLGGFGTGGLAGGRGGDAIGGAGDVQVGVANGPLAVVTNTAAFDLGDGLFVNARMVGGNGGGSGALGGRGGDATSGFAMLLNRGGTVTASQVELDVTAAGGSGGSGDLGDLGGGNAVGGLGRILGSPRAVSNQPGSLTITSSADVNASAVGGVSTSAPGSGKGGAADLLLQENGATVPFTGTLDVLGSVQLLATGTGGAGLLATLSGAGTGGTVTLASTRGDLVLAGAATLNASGVGGSGGSSGLAGTGTGGSANITLAGGELIVQGNLDVQAGGLLGAAQGGSITVASSGPGGALRINSPLARLDAQGLSGDGAGGGPAVSATGGAILIDAGAGSLLQVRQPGTGGALDLLAAGRVLNVNQFAPAPATGGSITLSAGGQLQVAGGGQSLILNAQGEGGFGGTLGNGGPGTGGTVLIEATAGGAITLDPEGQLFTVLASGVGGESDLTGGGGIGGTIRIDANGGSISVPGTSNLFADGFAGLAPSRGNADGGSIELGFSNGGVLDFGGALVGFAQASGLVADGGIITVTNAGGGAMTVNTDLGLFANAESASDEDGLQLSGGSVTVATAAGGVFTVLGQAELTADAFGFGSGAGWAATGGTAGMATSGPTSIGGLLRLTANAGFQDGGGGQATGGTVSLAQLAGSFSGAGLDASAFALVGSATAAEPIQGGSVSITAGPGAAMEWSAGAAIDVRAEAGGVISGNAAAATGGTVNITAQGVLDFAALPTALTIDARAVGGASDDGNGGAGTGGSVNLAAAGAAARLGAGQIAVDVAGTGGTGVNGPAGAGTAGAASIGASNGGIVDVADALAMQAVGSGAPGSRAGVLQLLAQTGGSIALGTLDLLAAGDLAPATGRSGLVAGLGAGISIAGDALLSSVGDIGLNDGGTVTAGGTLFISAGGQLLASFGTPGAGATGSVTAADLYLEGSAINLATALGTSSGDLGLVSNGPITAGNLASARHLVLLAGSDIGIGGASTGAAGTFLVGDVSQRSLIAFPMGAPPDYTALLASPPLQLNGGISIGGNVVTDLLSLSATGPILLSGTITAGSVVLDSGSNITLAGSGNSADDLTNTPAGDSVLASIQVSGGISLSSAGLASLSGNIAASAINVSSANIAIGTGIIGGPGTTSISLTSSAASSVIGGGGTTAAGVYSLSNAEFGVLRASAITVSSPSGSMTLEQLALPAIPPGNAGVPGVLFSAAGVLRVTGAVAMAQAGPANRLALGSGTRIEVVQGSGSILLGASADDPAGTLTMIAPSVRVASDPVLADIASGTLTGAARTAALNALSLAGVPGGSIAAGAIAITASNDVLIQNNGTAIARAGFTAGAGGLVITATGQLGAALPLDLVINGRIRNAAGQFATNAGTINLVQVDPAVSSLTPTSTVNGCLFGQPCLLLGDGLEGPVITILTSVAPLTPERQLARGRLAEPAERLPVAMQQRLFDFGPLFRDVDATDPVTSGGNPALWLEQPTPPPAGRQTGGQE